MDTRQLRYFTAVCEFRNLSHAADHCHTAASALSHHIAALEEELGTALFLRKPRGMEPTAAGLRLLDHARRILDAFETAATDVRRGQAEISGSIAVGMPFSVINVIGAELMRSVIEDMPRVRLLIREGLSGLTYNTLRQGEVEAALIFNPPPDTLTRRQPLLEEALFCIGQPQLIGTEEAPITVDEMAQLPLSLLQSGNLLRALSDRPGQLARLEASARIRLASVAGTLAALRAGLACTLAPKVLVADDLRRGTLVARPVIEPAPMRTLYLVTDQDLVPTPLNEWMQARIATLVTEAVRDGHWDGARLPSGV